MARSKCILGIDLGTSNSSVAYLDNHGYAQSIPNAEGETATPSTVFFSEEGPVVGTRAVKAYARHPERVVFHAKRALGDGVTAWEFDGVEYTPVDVSAIILRKLISDAREKIGDVDQAVISVPVHFNSHQRLLTIEAAEQAGIEILEVVNEPIAAALCYILGKEGIGFSALADDQRVLVYDLGGGTFDLGLVEYKQDGIRVLAANGDLKLGGLDWNNRIMDVVVEQVVRDQQINPRDPANRELLAHLDVAVEAAKRKMSMTEDRVDIRFKGKKISLVAKIDRRKFDKLTFDLLDRTRDLLEQIVNSAPPRIGTKKKGGWSDIDAMILAGGASRMPMVHRMVHQLVQNHPGLIKPIDPELSVSHGAALRAGLLSSQGRGISKSTATKRFDGISMQHATGVSLGLIVLNDRGEREFHTMIKQNSPLPAVARTKVATTKPGQTRVSLKFAETGREGEICRCVLDHLPANLPEGSKFDVDICYDESGLIQVIGKHRDSGRLATITVERSREEFV